MIKDYLYKEISKQPRRWLFYAGILACLLIVFLIRGVTQAYHSVLLTQKHNQHQANYELTKSASIRLQRQVAILRLLKHHLSLPPQVSLLDAIEHALNKASSIQYANMRQIQAQRVRLKWTDSQQFAWQWLPVLLKHHPQLVIESFHKDKHQVQLTLGGPRDS